MRYCRPVICNVGIIRSSVKSIIYFSVGVSFSYIILFSKLVSLHYVLG